MFLLGSKRFLEDFYMGSDNEMDAVMWALKNDSCTCLDRLEKIDVDVWDTESLEQAIQVNI